MSDAADQSDQRIMDAVDEGIAKVRRQSERSLPYIGVCHYCESGVGAGRIFCSKYCSDDYDFLQLARKRNGA